MKKLSIILSFYIFIILPICSQDFTKVADGIEHAKFSRKLKDNQPAAINLLRLDLKKVRLDAVHAKDSAIGLEKTSEIAKRYSAIAAINAGFFKMDGAYKGDPAGLLQIDGKLWSESYGDRIAIMIRNEEKQTKVAFAHLEANLYFLIGKDIRYPLGINRPLKGDEIIILTPELGKSVSAPSAKEIEVFKCHVICRPVAPELRNLPIDIPKDGYLLQFDVGLRKRLSDYLSGKYNYGGISLEKTLIDKDTGSSKGLEKMEDIVAGVPQLIKDGKIAITWEQEKIGKEFAETRHPRTAIAKLKNGKLLLITVDGRQPGFSAGMNLQELAEMLLEFGAQDAMNLDGGGSTTMILKDTIMNSPSDKTGERLVSDAILVFPRSK